jgi:hypothetical protein
MRILLCVLSLFVAFGCSDYKEANATATEAPQAIEIALNKSSEQASIVVERKLIRNGSISFEVNDVMGTRRAIDEATKATGGYVSSETQSGGDHPQYNQVLRIPGNSLDSFIAKIESMAIKIDSKTVSATDVTEEYVDIKSRLTAKKELEARYREIVKQAKTVEDILQVEEQIGAARSEIESMEGRLKYMDNKISYSTLELTYYEHYTVETPALSGKFAVSFRAGWNAWISFLVAITTTWPFLIILGVSAWLIMRRRKVPNQITPQQ